MATEANGEHEPRSPMVELPVSDLQEARSEEDPPNGQSPGEVELSVSVAEEPTEQERELGTVSLMEEPLSADPGQDSGGGSEPAVTQTNRTEAMDDERPGQSTNGENTEGSVITARSKATLSARKTSHTRSESGSAESLTTPAMGSKKKVRRSSNIPIPDPSLTSTPLRTLETRTSSSTTSSQAQKTKTASENRAARVERN